MTHKKSRLKRKGDKRRAADFYLALPQPPPIYGNREILIDDTVSDEDGAWHGLMGRIRRGDRIRGQAI